MTAEEAQGYLDQLPGWELVDGSRIRRGYRFKNFKYALDFANDIGRIAEEQGHHPELTLGWGHVDVELWTHKIRGLTESDFILAAKIEEQAAKSSGLKV